MVSGDTKESGTRRRDKGERKLKEEGRAQEESRSPEARPPKLHNPGAYDEILARLFRCRARPRESQHTGPTRKLIFKDSGGKLRRDTSRKGVLPTEEIESTFFSELPQEDPRRTPGKR